MKALTIKITRAVERPPVEGVERLDVICNSDGTLSITADAVTLARLGGRRNFGSAAPVQELLLDRIAEAWYAADCPPVETAA